MLKSILLAAAMAVSAAPALAQPNQVMQLDVARGATLGEKLVICDRAKLLANPPNRNATRSYVRVDNSRFDLALPPDFTRASGWYDYELERAYDRFRARGLVDSRDVDMARERYAVDLPSQTRRPTQSERRFLRVQANTCDRLIRDTSRY